MTVLIVDDEVTSRSQLKKRILKQHPEFDVEEAGSLQEAREFLALIAPELVFLNSQLPDGSGQSLLPFIKSQPQSAHVYILSKTFVSDTRGADAVIYRPDLNNLLESLLLVAESHRSV